jgi:endonuclease I
MLNGWVLTYTLSTRASLFGPADGDCRISEASVILRILIIWPIGRRISLCNRGGSIPCQREPTYAEIEADLFELSGSTGAA